MILIVGGVAGLIVGPPLLTAVLSLSPIAIPRYLHVAPSPSALVLPLAALLTAGLLAATLPALLGGRIGSADALKESSRSVAGRGPERRWIALRRRRDGVDLDAAFSAVLVAAFSLSALTVTAVGLFALMSHAAARRASEMEIRLALGDTPRHAVVLLVRGSLVPIAAGAAAGLPLIVWASASVRGLLYEAEMFDGVAFFSALGALVLAALASGAPPARRIASVDPLTVVKAE